jgi:hypothetical protein
MSSGQFSGLSQLGMSLNPGSNSFMAGVVAAEPHSLIRPPVRERVFSVKFEKSVSKGANPTGLLKVLFNSQFRNLVERQERKSVS